MTALSAAPLSSRAGVVEIPNSGYEEPGISDERNVSFDGVNGGMGPVAGWSSNEPSSGGVIRVDRHYPGRTGNNVLYLHGTGDQSFHTENFDLGEELKSNTTYVLCFDVLRWAGVTLNDTVIFRAGLFTGPDYESRQPLKQFEGALQLIDKTGVPADKVTVTLVVTTGTVAPGTRFWIGGDAFSNSADAHRAHFDEFRLYTATPLPE